MRRKIKICCWCARPGTDMIRRLDKAGFVEHVHKDCVRHCNAGRRRGVQRRPNRQAAPPREP